MVRFKNRYLLLDYSHLPATQPLNERQLLALVKETILEMMGELLLAKVTFSLQIKYMALGRALLRVPRDHAQAVVAALFPVKGLAVRHVSATIRKSQERLFALLRGDLGREPTLAEAELINKIDYS